MCIRDRDLIAQVQKESQRGHLANTNASVSPRAAAFALLGMINWIYQWYKPEGNLQSQNLVPQFTNLVFKGILS